MHIIKFLLFAVVCCWAASVHAGKITIAAAADLKFAMDESSLHSESTLMTKSMSYMVLRASSRHRFAGCAL